MPSSRLAQDIHLRLLADGIVHYPQDEPLGPIVARNESAIDKELAEVRETLDWLLESKGAYLFHEEECPWDYGPDDGCNCRVQRAAALYEKLRTDK